MEVRDFYYLIRMVIAWVWRFKTSFPGLLLTSDFFHHATLTPLTTIILTTELVTEQLPSLSSADAKRQLEIILTQAKYLRSLLSQLKTPQVETFSPNQALQETVIRFHQPLLNQHIHWINTIPQTKLMSGYKLYFQEVASCLIQNGLEAYGNNHGPKTIVIISSVKNQHLVFQFCDHGQGMNWITQKFSCAKGFSRKPAISGIGLAFVKQMVVQHFKGSLLLQSQPGMGTLISLSLPSTIETITESTNSSDGMSMTTQPNSEPTNIHV